MIKHLVSSGAALAAALSVVFVTAACTDPVGDAPRAVVNEPTAEQPAQAAAPTTPPPAEAAAANGAPTDGTTLTFSEANSSVSFVGAKVTGKHDGGFKKLSGTVTVPPDGAVEKAKVDVTIDMTSVFTDTEKLTQHLKSADFFEVEKFPTARFTSTAIEKGADGKVKMTGDLTLHGVTKSISFPATVAITPEGAKAQAEFGINRKDFGIVYTGKADDLIKDEVLLKLDIQATKPAS